MTTAPVSTQRRDWFRILRDLSASGVRYADVARICNRNATTVRQWAEGVDPKETDARIVLALYAKHCPLKYLDHQKAFAIRLEIADDANRAGDPEPPADSGAGDGGAD